MDNRGVNKQRLDMVLVARGLVATRSRARDLILRGLVRVEGAVVTKPGALVEAERAVAVSDDAAPFVSRGGEKLAHALSEFGFSAAGCTCLDVGASTGGFTDVLLRAGASHVYAVDVGHGQLHASLREDPRVVTLERTDARSLTSQHIPSPVGAVVADVSFISLVKILPAALRFAAPRAWLVALVKPQFEVGPDHVGKGGIVRDAKLRQAAVISTTSWIGRQPGWRVKGTCPSPIAGGDGNAEFLIGAEFNG